jgi:thiamine biosynthesis lipoprotein
MIHIFVFVLLSLLFCLVFACTEQEKMFKESRVLMDTYCTISVVSSSREQAQEAIEAGYAEIKKLETLLNYFADDSEITDINRNAGVKPVKVSKDTLDILQKTVRISQTTAGIFDPTIAPLVTLWNFSKTRTDSLIPPGEEINNRLSLVAYQNILIDNDKGEVFLPQKGMELDLGGIAKGYGADRAVTAIRALGIQSALVAIAGDIRGFGFNTGSKPWKVGIQNPRPDPANEKPWEDVFAVLRLENKAISTSGDYQRFFIKNNKRYHHILDPRTGYPAESDLMSVTVIAPEGYLADSLSTAVFAFGLDEGLDLLKKLGLDAVMVDAGKRVFITSGLSGKVEILNKDYTFSQ